MNAAQERALLKKLQDHDELFKITNATIYEMGLKLQFLGLRGGVSKETLQKEWAAYVIETTGMEAGKLRGKIKTKRYGGKK